MFMNKSFIGMKLVAIASLTFFFQRFFVLSFMYIFEPHLTYMARPDWDAAGISLMVFDSFHTLFLILGLIAAAQTYSLHEGGRRLLILSLLGILALHFISSLPGLIIPTSMVTSLSESILIYIFLLLAIYVLSRPQVKEHFSQQSFKG